jgi:hypothetical protein
MPASYEPRCGLHRKADRGEHPDWHDAHLFRVRRKPGQPPSRIASDALEAMMYEIADLDGPLLDLAVATAEGDTEEPEFVMYNGEPCLRREFDPEGPAHYYDHTNDFAMWWALRYSREWEQGGPIISREKISVVCKPPQQDLWLASRWERGIGWTRASGPTALIAAMRCYAISKLGATFETE